MLTGMDYRPSEQFAGALDQHIVLDVPEKLVIKGGQTYKLQGRGVKLHRSLAFKGSKGFLETASGSKYSVIRYLGKCSTVTPIARITNT